MKKFLLPIAAVAMVAAPVTAQAQRNTESDGVDGGEAVVAIVAAAALIAGIIIAVNGDDEPVSA